MGLAVLNSGINFQGSGHGERDFFKVTWLCTVVAIEDQIFISEVRILPLILLQNYQ